jgi:calmodulin
MFDQIIKNDSVVIELEEAFFLFDYDKDGKITSRELGAAVRSVGLNPTEGELKEMVNDVNASKSLT